MVFNYLVCFIIFINPLKIIFMKQKLVLTFYNANGDVVPELSKDPASLNDVQAALMFLNVNAEIRVAVVECDEKGNTI